jgi:hypothetical protein
MTRPRLTLGAIAVLFTLLGMLALKAQAQQDSGLVPVYDDFNSKWLDPNKWQPINPSCWGNVLECVREVRNGKLRLAARNFGATDSDSGIQWSETEVNFINPNAVTSVTADVNVRSFSGIGCLTNSTDWTHTQVQIDGNFFNAGAGDPSDDISALLIFWVDTTNPKTMGVSVYWGRPWPLGTDVPFASYPIGTEVTATLKWDKANHQFIATTKAKGENGKGSQLVLPYSFPDTALPANPLKSLQASQHTLNCTSAKTYGQVEATFDNVIINQ